ALSPRASRAMITVNMGGLSETLFESELFGHVKARLLTQRRIEQDASSSRMRARCSWMRSQISRLLNRQNSCGSSRQAISSASVHQKHFMPTCESSPLQTQIWRMRSQLVVFGRTSFFG